MTWVAVAIAGSAILGGVVSSDASRRAAHTQADAANQATDTQLQIFNRQNDQQAPWRNAGQVALKDILGQFGPDGYFNHQFNRDDLNANLAPNYEFMRDQGIAATTNASHATGAGGNTLADIAKFTTGYAQNAYQQAFQNYNAQRGDIFNRLASIAGLGQSSTSAAFTGAPSFAAGIAGTQQGAGNALAAGQVGQANAFTGALNNGMGWYSLSRFFPQSTSYTPTSGPQSGIGDGGPF